MLYLQLIAHLILVLLWLRIWVKPANEFYFNPFLSGTTRFIDSILNFLRPVLMLPDQAAAFLLLAFFCVFKTLFFLRFGNGVILSFGTLFSFTPPPQNDAFPLQVLYGVLQFALFLVRLWTLYFFITIISPPKRLTRAGEAFAFFTRPFSLLPFVIQPFILIGLHFCLTITILNLGFTPATLTVLIQEPHANAADLFQTGNPLLLLLKTGWLSMMSFFDGLMWVNNALLLCLLGSFLSLIFGLKTVMLICTEGLEVFLGRFWRRQTATSGVDFTPIIFYFIVYTLYSMIQIGLYQLISSPLFIK
jgi:hypothetical protein